MKKSKGIVVGVLTVLLLTSGIMYRKYNKAKVRTEQERIQREKARKVYEYQKEQERLHKQKLREEKERRELFKKDSIRRSGINKKMKQLQENRKKLEAELKKKNN